MLQRSYSRKRKKKKKKETQNKYPIKLKNASVWWSDILLDIEKKEKKRKRTKEQSKQGKDYAHLISHPTCLPLPPGLDPSPLYLLASIKWFLFTLIASSVFFLLLKYTASCQPLFFFQETNISHRRRIRKKKKQNGAGPTHPARSQVNKHTRSRK